MALPQSPEQGILQLRSLPLELPLELPPKADAAPLFISCTKYKGRPWWTGNIWNWSAVVNW